MKELINIEIGHGIGSIEFGMTMQEIEEIIGKPDEIEKYSYDESTDDLAESWHYDAIELSVAFEDLNDWKLTSIAVSSPGYLLNGKKLIGLSKDEVIKEIKDMELGQTVYEDCSTDEDPNLFLLSFDATGLNLWFDNDILSEIQWGLLLSDENDKLD